jgi:glucokinase
VVQPANQQRPKTISGGNAPLLAADIRGTHARVGLVTLPHDGDRGISLLCYRKYNCADHPSLTSILRHFITDEAREIVNRGDVSRLETPEAVTAAAQGGSDSVARETFDMFCALLGSLIGDLVMLYGAHGGAYLTGGVLPHIYDFLKTGSFVDRFLDKGRLRVYLERVPVRLMEHGTLGVIGAAGWYLDNVAEK